MAFVEFVVENLLKNLGDALIKEARFLIGVRDEVEWLEAEFRRMRCFLKDADTKQEEGDERVKNWVQEVRDVAYDAEDVIDTFVFKIARLRQTGFVGRIKRYAFIFSEWNALHKVGSEIKRIKNKIREISESRLAYGIANIGQEAGTSSAGRSLQEWRFTSPNVPEPDFVGFENDLEELVERLTKGEQRRCVVSVVGMGGLGKTTLTKKLYNTGSVKKHFDSHAWISVSQEYAVADLLHKVAESCNVMIQGVEKMKVDELRDNISKYLNDKRYLVVLDDLWTDEAWDNLKHAFPENNKGSRVVITTRNKDVALYADVQSKPHELRFLNNEESWDLFCKKAFPGLGGICPPELEELGRQIVEKCSCLPLAIVVIAGLLSRKEPSEWENVRKSITWQFVQGGEKISSIISLSYKNLPYHLKPCFLYLGIFPEDYEFRAKKLIQLWTAEGLLQQRGDETLEEVGLDCLKELIQRNMIQVANKSSSEGIKSCRIHDLLRDLCISEAKKENFVQILHENVDADLSTSTARRFAIHYISASNEYPPLKSSTPHLRSVLIHPRYGEWLDRKQGKFLYGGSKLLRVLDLNGLVITKLPSEIGALIHLRYIGCTIHSFNGFASSMGNLQNLQTLIVTTFENVFNIPSVMLKMQQLRHFQVKSSWGSIKGHPRLDRTGNLQTLSGINAGEWMHGCLRKFTNLRKLGIRLDDEGAYADVLCESILKLECLQSLFVEGVQIPSNLRFTRLLKLSKLHLVGKLEKLPESTEFPTNLTKLTLKDTHLNQDPLVTLEKLKNLRILRLLFDSYDGAEMACSAQGFPRLEFLHLESLNQLEEWRVEKESMPNLLHLRIECCSELKKLPEGLQHVSTLKKLELWGMNPELKARLQENEGEDWHKIRHIPSIHIS
ncbi:putative disease resistance protein At1g50180 [Magnolia sinica]|uniref:putative disease resistance protein At1g50180 n=1 Tax=Magnolia sinica TaxID=86752 RepID=UPI002658D588|nr:putative disease resistance protein At1g50180 [Magnolia sinica]XP_058115150.1 putative disease resistance protein At1g50180 [Magnolia sinica]